MKISIFNNINNNEYNYNETIFYYNDYELNALSYNDAKNMTKEIIVNYIFLY